ncbi:flagellin [Rhizobium mongolense]|uniref:flagellin N-terminal helical domain-containing protein n=1 Tax=Rhizobium TaxID=379 RepID=UPI0024B0EEA4|nr:flagellin [Rhizobium sp. CC1099]WFU86073.1 flagellin [Rhizobium sp. CC1099]
MTSILTNTSAAMALATLRTVNGQLNRDQTMVSSGYRISTAADNAAYWSISTTMKSDAKAVNAARDAMALGSAKTDTAYEGIESEISVVSEFKAKLVAAMEKGVDKTKVQDELDQLAQQAVSISSSASFNGQNWLSTDITDIYDTTQNTASLVSGFIRTGSGVQVTSVPVDLSKISLFNTTGGGALQKDDRSTGTIGGLRNTDTFTHGGGSIQMFTFTGPLVFTDNTTAITLSMVLDADDPSTTTSPQSGTSVSVTIDRSLVDPVYPTLNGVISTRDQFAWVMRAALTPVGAQFSTVSGTTDGYALLSAETSGLSGSSIQVTSVNSTLASGSTGGLTTTGTDYGDRPKLISFFDGSFNVHSSAVLYLPVTINGTSTTVSIDRQAVDNALGPTDGVISSADDLVTVLNAAMTAQNVGVKASNQGTYILYEIDDTVHPEAGSKTSFGIGPAYDNLGNVPDFGLLDVDITSSSANLDYYLSGVESMLRKLTVAGSTLGSLQQRNSLQENFASKLIDNISSGVSKLVDSDMEEVSARMSALQTQQQLALKGLQIANSQPQAILSLFQ